MNRNDIPVNGSVWRHYKGRLYSVICVSNIDSERDDYPITVVYKNIETNQIWSRPLSKWFDSMTPVFDLWSLPEDTDSNKRIFTSGPRFSGSGQIAEIINFFKKTISNRNNP